MCSSKMMQPNPYCSALQKLSAFNLDEYVAGKSKVWTFWDCAPSEFPWTYSKDEYAYVIAGQFYVTYEGTRLPTPLYIYTHVACTNGENFANLVSLHVTCLMQTARKRL